MSRLSSKEQESLEEFVLFTTFLFVLKYIIHINTGRRNLRFETVASI